MVANTNHKLRVLIVEDDVDCATTTATLIQLAGHEVKVAPDGATALGTIGNWTPDVALVDLGLPDMNGCEVAQKLSRPASGKRPLLVAITGYGPDSSQWREAEAGFDLHLVKPADPIFLRKLLLRFESLLT
jgi:CheY-like chemotaxis protein